MEIILELKWAKSNSESDSSPCGSRNTTMRLKNVNFSFLRVGWCILCYERCNYSAPVVFLPSPFVFMKFWAFLRPFDISLGDICCLFPRFGRWCLEGRWEKVTSGSVGFCFKFRLSNWRQGRILEVDFSWKFSPVIIVNTALAMSQNFSISESRRSCTENYYSTE